MTVLILSVISVLVCLSSASADTINLATVSSSFVRLGRDPSDSQMQQSIKIGDAKVTGVTLAFARRGTPSVPITVALRDSRLGANLATATVQPANVSTDTDAPTFATFLFNSVALASGERFLDISVPLNSLSESNHYYLALGRYSGDGTFYFKNDPLDRDVVGSVHFLPGEPPQPPPDDPPPTPPEPGSYEGFGAQTRGGADGNIYHVKTLACEGPGSLRDALSQGNRHVVFDVAGKMSNCEDIEILHSNITIDGFTAPFPGFTLYSGNNALVMHGTSSPYIRPADAHDIIIRGLKFVDNHGDGIQIGWGAYNIVIDRVTVIGSGDGNIDITTGAHDITVQWSILAGPSEKAMLIKPMTGEGAWGEIHPFGNISVHHNLFVGSGGRNPRISNGLGNTGKAAKIITTDMRNNVVARWLGGIGTDVECGAKANVINNYFFNPQRPDVALIVRGGGDFAGCKTQDGQGIGGFAYVQGNKSGDGINLEANKWIRNDQPLPYQAAPVTTTDSCAAAKDVMNKSGMHFRDAADKALVATVAIKC